MDAFPSTPTPTPAPRSRRGVVAVLVAAGVVVAAVVGFLALAGGGDGGGSGDEGAALGEAIASATTTTAGNSAPVVSEATTTTGTGVDSADLPPVTIPAESAPPTTIPGAEPSSVPGGDGELPLWAHIVVDLPPGGYLDFPVYLRADQHFQLLSLADDGIGTRIEVFAPDGSSEGSWEGGEPGVVNGLEWYGGEDLPATGTYVIRVVHRGGSDDRFALGFFGDA